jgi:hypothetical protein
MSVPPLVNYMPVGSGVAARLRNIDPAAAFLTVLKDPSHAF